MEPIPETQEVLDELKSFGDTETEAELLKMGRRAQEIVPQCVGLSLGLFADGLTYTLVASSDEIATLDAVQYLDGGPCVAAAHQNETVEVDQPEMIDEHRWLMYAQATAAAGVASSLTLPIRREEHVIGSVNLYASTADAFEGRHQELAVALDASASGAVSNADLSFSTRLEAIEAPARLTEQDDINMAVGIISASQDVDLATARERLRQAAARGGVTEGQAARAVRTVLLP